MKKILFISYTNFFGGAEYVLWDYIRRIDINNIYIYTTNRKEVLEKYKQVFKEKNIFCSERMDIVSIRKKTIKSILNIFYNLYKINQIVKKYDIEVLYGNNTLDILLITLYKKYINKNIKTISHIHDILDQRLYINYIKKNDEYIDKYIVPSRITKKSLEICNIKENKIEVIYNGIDTKSNFLKKNNDKCSQIYCIGQICKRKRQDMFIDIINNLNRKCNKYKGFLIGKITEDKYYKDIKNKFNSDIIYLGELEREKLVKDIYPNIDILLLTSDRDPLPTVILEAMSMGIIVIARDVDGVKEIISDGRDGFIFAYDSNIEYIVHLVEYIECLSIEEKQKIGKRAQLKIKEKFSMMNKVIKVNKIIEEL